MKLITLRCTNCGADLQIDSERKEAYCTFCGTKLFVDDESIRITNRIVDEARLKEAEVRLKRLEYEHERELRQENRLQEHRRVFLTAVIVYVCALLFTYLIQEWNEVFPFVLVFGGIALLSIRSAGRREVYVRQEYVRQSYVTSPKSKLTAAFLCFFLGMFGAHYFYVGRIGMGILYIFTLGLFGIGWLADIIRILSGRFTDREGLPLREA